MYSLVHGYFHRGIERTLYRSWWLIADEKQWPTPEALDNLTKAQWQRFAKTHRLTVETKERLWENLKTPQLPVRAHVVRAKALAVETLLDELETVLGALDHYKRTIEVFFDQLPVARIAKTLPGGKSGVNVPSLWAELGDGAGRWE